MEATMPWTEITRRQYRREGLRYASDMTDGEWMLVEPFLPGASPIGRPRIVELRTVVNAVLYMASTGCQWRQIPKEFAPIRLFRGISTDGRGMARGLASATRWSRCLARRSVGRRARALV